MKTGILTTDSSAGYIGYYTYDYTPYWDVEIKTTTTTGNIIVNSTMNKLKLVQVVACKVTERNDDNEVTDVEVLGNFTIKVKPKASLDLLVMKELTGKKIEVEIEDLVIKELFSVYLD